MNARRRWAYAAFSVAMGLSLVSLPGISRAQHGDHAACHGGLAGSVSRALMDKPVGLTKTAGDLHQKVSTRSAKAQAYYDQGFAYLASYVWIEAARSFHEALRQDPALAMAHLGLAKAYAGADALDEAHSHLQRATELSADGKVTPKEAKWIALGGQQMEALQAPAEERASKHRAYKQAIDELIVMDPRDPNAWVLRGNAEEPGAWGRGQFGGVGSIAYYEAALRLDPEHFAAHHFLVHSYELIGHHAIAAEHARKYVAAVPGVPHAQHMYAHVLPRLGKWKQALAQLTTADRLEREYYRTQGIESADDWHHGHNLHLLGIVNLRLGNDAEAERLFQEAFALQDRGPRAGYSTAPWLEYLLLRGRFEEALTAATQVEARPSAAARFLGAALGGEALLALGRVDEAKQAEVRVSAASGAYLQSVQGTPYESLAPLFAAPYIKTLEGELALREKDPAAGEAILLGLADGLASSPLLDAWAVGLFHLQRMAADAQRAGRAALAVALVERMRKIDPEFVPRDARVTAPGPQAAKSGGGA